jgi:FkbM family methyltransferase
MKYPALTRSALGATGIKVDITGPRRDVLLRTFDRLFWMAGASRKATIRLDKKTSLELNLENPSERMLYYAGQNILNTYRRSHLFWMMRHLAGQKGLFIDIGANLGIYSYLARTLGFETLSFEPEPVHHSFLHRNRATIGATLPFALSDKCGKLQFHVSSAVNPGSSSLIASQTESQTNQTITVDVLTFDDAMRGSKIDPSSVTLIKIDVEGNEEYTVSGMELYLKRPDAAPIWCEVRGPESPRRGNSVLRVASYMDRFGLKPFQCIKRRLLPYRVGIDPAPQVFDLLFAVPTRHTQLFN